MVNLNATNLNELFVKLINKSLETVKFSDKKNEYYLVRSYLAGKSLLQIGDEYGLKRERVRQVIAKELQNVLDGMEL